MPGPGRREQAGQPPKWGALRLPSRTLRFQVLDLAADPAPKGPPLQAPPPPCACAGPLTQAEGAPWPRCEEAGEPLPRGERRLSPPGIKHGGTWLPWEGPNVGRGSSRLTGAAARGGKTEPRPHQPPPLRQWSHSGQPQPCAGQAGWLADCLCAATAALNDSYGEWGAADGAPSSYAAGQVLQNGEAAREAWGALPSVGLLGGTRPAAACGPCWEEAPPSVCSWGAGRQFPRREAALRTDRLDQRQEGPFCSPGEPLLSADPEAALRLSTALKSPSRPALLPPPPRWPVLCILTLGLDSLSSFPLPDPWRVSCANCGMLDLAPWN